MGAAPQEVCRSADLMQANHGAGDGKGSIPLTERIYRNVGNPLVIDQVRNGVQRVLDVGCGAGDNAALLKSRGATCEIFGITRSDSEAESARRYMNQCWVDDIEGELPPYLRGKKFDCIIFSHVLEHLRNPQTVVARFSELLPNGGQIVIAVPNVMFFKMRLQFLFGNFEYHPEGGILDDTHLHFYTWFTADRYLLAESADLRLMKKVVSGYVPYASLRRHFMPKTLTEKIDRLGLRYCPNLFGDQIVLSTVKVSSESNH